MNLTPRLFIEIAGLVELYNEEVAAAKASESDGGEAVTPAEMFGIAIAVGGPALKRFFIPSLPDETIDRAAKSVTDGLGSLDQVRERAAAVLDKVEDTGAAVISWLK